MSEQRIKAVLFDLGETLLNFGRISTTRVFREGARSSHEYLKSQGQPVARFEVYCWMNLLRLKLRSLVASLTGNDFDAFEMLQRVGTRKGITLSDEQWREFAWRWYEPLSRRGTIEDDTVNALSSLKGQGLKLGILSNTFVSRDSLERHMEQLGILDFFPVRVYSYEQPRRKPDAGIFKHAAELIGEVFESIAFVGDRIDKDVRPALDNGMVAVLKDAYTNEGKQTPAGALKISSIAELPALIEGINAEGTTSDSR